MKPKDMDLLRSWSTPSKTSGLRREYETVHLDDLVRVDVALKRQGAITPDVAARLARDVSHAYLACTATERTAAMRSFVTDARRVAGRYRDFVILAAKPLTTYRPGISDRLRRC